jgi:hypothetical protein
MVKKFERVGKVLYFRFRMFMMSNGFGPDSILARDNLQEGPDNSACVSFRISDRTENRTLEGYPPPPRLQSLCFEYFAPKILRTLELRVVVTHAISIPCEDPRKIFQTLELHAMLTHD